MRAGRRKARRETEVRAALAEFAAAMEARLNAELERSRRAHLAMLEAIERLRHDTDDRELALTRALESVTRAIDHVADRMEAERVQQERLVELVAHLADDRPAIESNSERLLGGRITAYRAGSDVVLEPVAIGNTNGHWNGNGHDIRAPLDGDAVSCYLDARWVDGFEVVDVMPDGDVTRYRLRRLSDGSVSHRLFDADEVRLDEVRIEPGPDPVGAATPLGRRGFWKRS
jgi:hypothetical protein